MTILNHDASLLAATEAAEAAAEAAEAAVAEATHAPINDEAAAPRPASVDVPCSFFFFFFFFVVFFLIVLLVVSVSQKSHILPIKNQLLLDCQAFHRSSLPSFSALFKSLCILQVSMYLVS
jgi:hypothetical protein